VVPVAAAALLLLASGSVFAQATRTWVSGVGDDVNPCSRTAPCKTWAGAISKTAAGGTINCLDPGGFGTVTITKSMTISCKPSEGSALASGSNGVVINGVGINVVLRGLEIDGGPDSSPGLNGVRFLQGASLVVEDSTIRDFKAGGSNGYGIVVLNPSMLAKVTVVRSMITGNGAGTAGGGIQIAPTGSGSVDLTVIDSVLADNTVGLRVDSASTTGRIHVAASRTTASGAPYHGFVALGTGGPVRMTLQDVLAVSNAGEAVRAVGAAAIVRVGGSVLAGNGVGFSAVASGRIYSYGNNQVDDNSIAGAATTSALR